MNKKFRQMLDEKKHKIITIQEKELLEKRLESKGN